MEAKTVFHQNNNSLRHGFSVIMLLIICGCGTQPYVQSPIDLNQGYRDLTSRTLGDPGFQAFLLENNIAADNQSELDYLSCVLLYFNQDIDHLFRELAVVAQDKNIAATRRNPNIQVPFGYYSVLNQDAKPWTLGFVVDLFYERPSKREARMMIADSQLEITRLNIVQTAWDLRHQLYQSYWNYHLNAAHVDLIEQEIALKRQIIELLETRKQFGEANSFEISSARLDLQSEIYEKSQFQLNQMESYYDMLALFDLTDQIYSDDFLTGNNLSAENLPENTDFKSLQNIALHQRTDLLMELLKYKISESNVRIAIENQYPDINLSPGFLFDQSDNLWTLGASWVLPLLKNQQPHIDKSLAERASQQAVVLEVQSKILNELKRLEIVREYQDDAYQNMQKIINEFDKRYEILSREYEMEAVNRLDFLRGQLEKINLQQSELDIRVGSYLVLGRMERAVEFSIGKDLSFDRAINILLVHKYEQRIRE